MVDTPFLHDSIHEVLERSVVSAGAAPGAMAAVAVRHSGQWWGAMGWAGQNGLGEPVGPESIYDLASLTKPVVAVAASKLVSRGCWDWGHPLKAVLPEVADCQAGDVPLEWLASHRAGLAAHRLVGPVRTADQRIGVLRTVANSRRPECEGRPSRDGFPAVYSDLGFILLGAALERRSQLPLDELVAREVAGPLRCRLGSARQWRGWLGSERFAEQVVPTEDVQARGGVLRGVVHDDNAWWLTEDACSGHAGLFGGAAAVLGFAVAVLRALAGEVPEWLPPELAREHERTRAGGEWRLGFDAVSAQGSSAGPAFDRGGMGHLGFTGTSFWLDLARGRAVVLLSNRTWPSRDNIQLRAARPGVHSALHQIAGELPQRRDGRTVRPFDELA